MQNEVSASMVLKCSTSRTFMLSTNGFQEDLPSAEQWCLKRMRQFLNLLNWNVYHSVVVTTLNHLVSEELQVEFLFFCVFCNCTT